MVSEIELDNYFKGKSNYDLIAMTENILGIDDKSELQRIDEGIEMLGDKTEKLIQDYADLRVRCDKVIERIEARLNANK